MFVIIQIPTQESSLPFLYVNERLVLEQVAYIRTLALSYAELYAITEILGQFFEFCSQHAGRSLDSLYTAFANDHPAEPIRQFFFFFDIILTYEYTNTIQYTVATSALR